MALPRPTSSMKSATAGTKRVPSPATTAPWGTSLHAAVSRATAHRVVNSRLDTSAGILASIVKLASVLPLGCLSAGQRHELGLILERERGAFQDLSQEPTRVRGRVGGDLLERA